MMRAGLGARRTSYGESWQRKKQAIEEKITLGFKRYILLEILRQRQPSPTKDGRHIELDATRLHPLIDERTGHAYISNSIRSSRYTILTFLPLQLWFQFTKAANCYFLVMGILQLIPGFSTTGTYTTVLPLFFFLTFSISREGYDDFRRYRLDRVENRRSARVLHRFRPLGIQVQGKKRFMGTVANWWDKARIVLRGVDEKKSVEGQVAIHEGKAYSDTTISEEPAISESDPWVPVKWIDLKVGNIIELARDDRIPADIVLLYANGRNGFAYIETMDLDGETNLKSREPPKLLADRCGTMAGISRFRAHFAVEDPNLNLYEFNGKVTIDGKTLPLTLNNVVYRGSILRNTSKAIGIVVNTGEECKIRMNANKNPQTKAPALQKITNKVVILLSVFVVLLAVGCTAGYEIWSKVFEKKAWYLAHAHLPPADIFIAFAIEFNNLIPLALYVSLEIVKFCQFLMLHDIEMYDGASNTPMVSNTQTIFENLGQVTHIFTDKTGTLTENVMKFRGMSVAGIAWFHDIEKARAGAGLREEDVKERIVRPRELSEATTTGASMVSSSPLIQNKPAPEALEDTSATADSEPKITTAHQGGEPVSSDLIQYLRETSDTPLAEKMKLFLLSLAICHTCFPEVKSNGEISYQASSPDETALVEAAQDLGYMVIDRTTQSITLLTQSHGIGSSVRETYRILDVIDFSSHRKRMSVIVRFPCGNIYIFCKGADSVLFPRLALQPELEDKLQDRKEEDMITRKSEDEKWDASIKSDGKSAIQEIFTAFEEKSNDTFGLQPIPDDKVSWPRHRGSVFSNASQSRAGHRQSNSFTPSERKSLITRILEDAGEYDELKILKHCLKHIDEFATKGLRTLLYGYRVITDEEYQSWAKVYHAASSSLVNRQQMIEAAGELVETDLILAGATAIEDKLQKGVPETIEKLQRADIKIWMLTGDKRETAINIAHSARICKPHSHLIIPHHDQGTIETQIASAALEITKHKHSVIIIDGQILTTISSNPHLSHSFYTLLHAASSTIISRASPSQKASLVTQTRNLLPHSLTLAIGDGGNDISMIQAAHVGVGISGLEGLQAARVADYSIAQFRFLQRLLLVHGHWSYVRTSKFILWTFWKEMLFYALQIMYQRWNGYTGTSLYENNGLTVWNTLFSSLCVILPGIFEKDLSAETLLAVPELYRYGQQSKGFNMRVYRWWMLLAGIQSQIIYWLIYYLYGVVTFTEDQGLFAIGDLAFSICLIFINFKLLILDYHHKTWIPITGCAITIIGWFIWSVLLSYIYGKNPAYEVYHGFTEHFGKNLNWWAVQGVILVILVVIDLVIKAVRRVYWSREIERWQLREKDEAFMGRVKESGEEGGGFTMGGDLN